MGKVLLFILIMILNFSCEVDNEVQTIYGKWEVISLYNEESIVQENNGNHYILEFENDSIAKLSLDVNNCMTKCAISNYGQINFKIFNCTYMCCDSDFSVNLLEVLKTTKRYEIIDNILSVSGVGEVKLRKMDY